MRLEQRFRELADRLGQATAVDDGNSKLSYAQVQQRADQLAKALTTAKLTPAEPLAVIVANRGDDLAAFLAVWQAQGVVVPVHQSTPPVAREALYKRLGNRFVLDGDLRQLKSDAPPARDLLQSAGTIIFTSGSTGQPKGVVLSAQRASDKLAMIGRMTDWQYGEDALIGLQLTFSFGQWATWLTLLNGGCVYLRARFDAREFQDLLATGKIQRFPAVPTMLRHLLALNETSDFAGQIMAGGEPLPAALGNRVIRAYPQAKLGDIYGLTETGTSDFFVQPVSYAEQAGTLGYAGDKVQWQIDPDSDELQIRSPWQMLGYLDDPEQTAAAFSDGWFKTGDLAQATDTGALRLIGRAKDLIVRSGNKISPLEIEAAFASHPAVQACLAAGVVSADQSTEIIHLALMLDPSAQVSLQTLRDWASQYLERFKMPNEIHLVNELPSGSTGKADRNAWRAQILANNSRLSAGSKNPDRLI